MSEELHLDRLAGAKLYSACLLGRVARVGEQHRQAARRRAWTKREGERREEECRAEGGDWLQEGGYS